MSVNRLEIQRREQQMAAANSFISGSPVSHALRILDLADIEPGIRVVDLAAGASGLTAYLLSRGVSAYAVDKAYFKDFQTLTDGVLDYWDWVRGEYADSHPDHRSLVEPTRDSLSKFAVSYETDPEHYIACWLTQLNIPDNFAQRTVSLYGLLYLVEDPQVVDMAMDEAIRITQPDGSIIAAPFDLEYTQQNEFLGRLCRREIGQVHIEQYQVGPLQGLRLRFIKS